jgi:hypothetical protein
MATAVNEAATIERRGSRRGRVGWVLGGLAAVMMAAVAVVAIEVGSAPEPVPAIDKSSPVTSMLYSPDELILKRLAAGGQIPAETLDGDAFVTKRLVNQGLVPKQALMTESDLIKQLVNRGLVPAQAADSSPAE